MKYVPALSMLAAFGLAGMAAMAGGASAQTAPVLPAPTPITSPARPGEQSSRSGAAPSVLPTQPVPVVGNRISTRYAFVLHGAFFSLESRADTLLDPQVFVQDPRVSAGVGPQAIPHAANFRPALFIDDPASSIANANGDPLGHNLANWLQARGTASLVAVGSTERITLSFLDLISGGHYSLFELHFNPPAPITFTPLDGRGTTNNFVAESTGRATVTVVAPQVLTHAYAIVLVYHSDAQYHGTSRGIPGVTAHHQLILRIP